MSREIRRILAWLALCLAGAFVVDSAAAADKSGVSPSRLRLPQGPGSLGGVGENVEPNLNMGLMSHGVPIRLPQGYAGATPTLRLAYNSGAGSAEVGIGWSLPIPSIERMTSRGLPRYSRDDGFVAGGSDELVRVARTATTTTYRARFERGFVRYTWVDAEAAGTGGYFKAEYPDGSVGYFGAGSDGTLDPDAQVAGADGRVFRYQLVELVDVLGHRARYGYDADGSAVYPAHVGYVFDGDEPRYEVVFEYEPRPDVLSDAKPGFELRWARRLTGIRVLVRGEQLRRYELGYESEALSGGLSRLASVREFGLEDEGPYPIAFQFAYSAGLESSSPQLIEVSDGLGVDFRTGTADIIDLNGDALPDVVDTGQGTHEVFLSYFDAAGAHRLEGPEQSEVGGVSLASTSAELFDLDGDGFSDFVDSQNFTVLWNRGAGDWDESEILDGLASIDLSGLAANLRFFDYDNDKKIDLLFSDGQASWVHENQGDGSFVQVNAGVDAIGAGFAEGLELADMNGDGLADAVRQADSLVAYRLNLGLGRFSDWIEMAGVPATLAGDERHIDLNGDGPADLVAVRSGAVIYAINRGGRAYGTLRTLDASGALPIPELSDGVSVRFADMNGSGSTDVVWIDASGHISYLELFPERPNLLVQIDNGIGRQIEVAYGSSVEHMTRDGGPGAWQYRLPHAMLTVDEIVVRDALSGVEERQRIHYKNGFYDGAEKQFRGFSDVEVERAGDDSIETGRDRHHFDVGATDAYHKGNLLWRETGSSEKVFVRLEQTHADCELSGVPETQPAIRFVCQSGERQIVQEGEGPDEWVTLEEQFAYDGFGNRTLSAKLGVVPTPVGGCEPCTREAATQGSACGTECLGDESYERTTFVEPAAGGAWILGKPSRHRRYGVDESALYTEQLFYYDGEPFVGLPRNSLTRGLLTRTRQKVRAGSDAYVDNERSAYDQNGAVTQTIDANGHRRVFEYDAASLLLLAESVRLDDPARERPYSLRMAARYHPILEAVIESSAWQRVEGDGEPPPERLTMYDYDAFGRITKIAHPGDTLQAATQTFAYELEAPASRVIRRGRSQHGAPLDLEEIQCFDGFGRSYQTRTRVADGRYQVSGFSVFNAQGAVRQSYEPYSAAGDGCDSAPPDAVRFSETRYDASGRLRRVTQPDDDVYGFASFSEMLYRPLRTIAYDAEDTDPDSPNYQTPTTTWTDGLGRTARVERLLGPDQPIRVDFTYDELGRLRGYVDARGNQKRQAYDLLDRVTRVEDPDSGVTEFQYDAAGNLVSQTDARGVETRIVYDELDRKVAEWDAADETATKIEYGYDAPESCPNCTHSEGQSATVSYPVEGDRAGRGSDEYGYDERGQPVYVGRNIGGRLYEFHTNFDNAGRVFQARYPAGLDLQFVLDGAGRISSIPGHLPEVGYDARGLVNRVSFANGVSTSYEHDSNQRLSAIDTVDAAETSLQAYRYRRDRVGNILEVGDGSAPPTGPSANAAFAYDSEYRLLSAQLDPGRPGAEVISIAYDDVDRVTQKTSNLGDASREHAGAYKYGEHGAGPHALTRAGKRRLRYDAAGNLVQRDDDAYEWDFMGRMSRSLRGSKELARFSYGPDSERVKKVEHGQTTYYLTPDFEVRDGIATLYVRLAGRRVAKILATEFAPTLLPDLGPVEDLGDSAASQPDGVINAGDAWIAQAALSGIFELGQSVADAGVIDELLAASARRLLNLAPESNINYLHSNHLGTPVLVTDVSGAVIARAEHYPHGSLRPGNPPFEEYSFTGKEQDGATELSYFGARYYDPRLGVWTAPDPLVSPVLGADASARDLNGYAYVWNNPIGLRDADGWCPVGGDSASGCSGEAGSGHQFVTWRAADSWNQSRQQTMDMLYSSAERQRGAMGIVSLVGLTFVATAMDLGQGFVDVLYLGKGVVEGGWRGWGRDLFRGLTIAAPFLKSVRSAGGALSLDKIKSLFGSSNFSSISRKYWAARGGAGGNSIAHWGPSQKSWLPKLFVNSSLNLVVLPISKFSKFLTRGYFGGDINRFAGFAAKWKGHALQPYAIALDWGVRLGIPGLAWGTFEAAHTATSKLQELWNEPNP